MTTILFFFWDGFSQGVAGATLIGTWSNILDIRSINHRLEIHSANRRLDIKSANERLEP